MSLTFTSKSPRRITASPLMLSTRFSNHDEPGSHPNRLNLQQTKLLFQERRAAMVNAATRIRAPRC